jgi:hypothetical protein
MPTWRNSNKELNSFRKSKARRNSGNALERTVCVRKAWATLHDGAPGQGILVRPWVAVQHESKTLEFRIQHKKEKAAEAAGGIEKPRSILLFPAARYSYSASFLLKREPTVSVSHRTVKLFDV